MARKILKLTALAALALSLTHGQGSVSPAHGAALAGGEALSPTTTTPSGRARLPWLLSVAALTAASAADIATTQGHPELNPLLASNGQLGARGYTLKIGLTAAVPLIQWTILRRHPERAARFTLMNGVAAGAWGAVSIHNARLR
jgi:hypothetical protein